MVSLGSSSSVEKCDDTVYFVERIVSVHSAIDERNLAWCKYLNLRHSSVNKLSSRYLFAVSHVDVSFSLISDVDFRHALCLSSVVADESQRILHDSGTKVELIYDTQKYINDDKVSLGYTIAASVGKISLMFKEARVSNFR